MNSKDFCPLCGTEDARFIRGLCESCFLKKNTLVELPPVVRIVRCRDCGKTLMAGKASELDWPAISALVKKKVRVRDLETGDDGFAANVHVKGIIGGVSLSLERRVPIEFRLVQCDACMRISSQYHAAIVQLRAKHGGKERLRGILKKAIAAAESAHSKDSLAVVTEVSEKKEGFDLKIGSKKAAQNAVSMLKKEFGAEIKFSTILIGMNTSGKEKHRFVFLVRA
jgi:nonsense-mediated mRNA decay protein 3